MTRLLTVPEAAVTLGISLNTVRRKLKTGELPGERITTPQGYAWRVLVADPPNTAPEEPAEQVPAEVPAEAPAAPAPTPSPAAAPASEGTVERLEAEVRRLENHNADLRTALDDARTELDARRREAQALLTLLARAREPQSALALAGEAAPAAGTSGAEEVPEEVPSTEGTDTQVVTAQEVPAGEVPTLAERAPWWRRAWVWFNGSQLPA